jgi:hypothetical protein
MTSLLSSHLGRPGACLSGGRSQRSHDRGWTGCYRANPTRREPMVAQTNASMVDAYMKVLLQGTHPALVPVYSTGTPFVRRADIKRSSSGGPNFTVHRGLDLRVNRTTRPVRRATRISDHFISVVGTAQAIQDVLGPTRIPHENLSSRTNGHVARIGHDRGPDQEPPPTSLQVGSSSEHVSTVRLVAARLGTTTNRMTAAIAPNTQSGR